MKQFHYVYITTNLINGKQYVGDHSTDNLDDDYLGSGKLISKAIHKYGKHNFKKEILESFNIKEKAFITQEKYIQKFNTLIPNGYNISPKGGHNVKNSLSEETKRKIKIGNTGKKLSDEHKLKLSISHKGKIFSEEHRLKLSNSKKGKILSAEHKLKVSESRKGIIFSEEQKRKIKEYHLGKKHSEETKTKISNSLKLNRYHSI
jgi:hypothetical protein